MTRAIKKAIAENQPAAIEPIALQRGPGRPPRIDKEKIMAVTMDIGLSDLTLASVAKRLGVSSQALYRYFPDRESLIDMTAEELVARFPIPPANTGEDWCVWAHRFARALLLLYEALPGMAERSMAKTQATPGVLNRFEMSIKVALASGFDETTALWATRSITEFVPAWVAREQRREALSLSSGVPYRAALQAAVYARRKIDLPVFASALKHSENTSDQQRFDYTLGCLIAGIGQNRKSTINEG